MKMNGIVINEGEEFYTDLKALFEAMGSSYKEYNWLITDYECYPQEERLAEIFSGEPVFISGQEIIDLLQIENFQWIWGVFSAFDKCVKKEDVFKYDSPVSEENENIWKMPLSLQHPLSSIEIIAWDSSLTVIISKDEAVISTLMKNKDSSIKLEQFIEDEIESDGKD